MRAIMRDQLLEEREEWRRQAHAAAAKDTSIIVMDPDDEIICDFCNGEIETDLIWIYKSNALCGSCGSRISAKEEGRKLG
jgi:hypothetical protein